MLSGPSRVLVAVAGGGLLAASLTGCVGSDDVTVDDSAAAPYETAVSSCVSAASLGDLRDDDGVPFSIAVIFESAEGRGSIGFDYRATGRTEVRFDGSLDVYDWTCEVDYDEDERSVTARIVSFAPAS
jgi:hypothetical protein